MISGVQEPWLRWSRHTPSEPRRGGVYVDPSATATMDMQTLIAGNQATMGNNDVWGTITMVP